MRHATALVAVGLLLTAGCIGGPLGGGETPSATPTIDQAPYPNTTATMADGPKERPERPGTLTVSAVENYVRTVEYRHAYNSLWMSDESDVHLDCGVESTVPEQAAYNVTVTCTGYSNTGGEAAGNRTATEVHADWGTQDVGYYVDRNTTIRFGNVDLA